MSLVLPVTGTSATATAIATTNNSQLAFLWSSVSIGLSLGLALLLGLSTYTQARLRAQGPFPLSAVAESWRPRASRAWRFYLAAHALLAAGLLAGAAAPLAPWGVGWVPRAVQIEGTARGSYLILTGYWGRWRSCVVDLNFEGPVCTEGDVRAPWLLLAGCAALHGSLLLFGVPAVALAGLAATRVASVAGGAAPLGGVRARVCGGCCSPGAPAVAALAWAAAAGAAGGSGAAWAGRAAAADWIAADAAFSAYGGVGAGAAGAGVGPGGALAAAACAALALGAALATYTGCARVGHIPGLGVARQSRCAVEDDELLHETDPEEGRGGKRGAARGRRLVTLRAVGVADASICEMH
jgi:hypothetical protein